MSLKVIEIFLIFSLVSSSFGLDLQRLTHACLEGALKDIQDVFCTTQKGVRIQTTRKLSKTFYCVSYEKKTGNKNEFEVLSFDLHNDDYDLTFTGANAIEDSATPEFKIYDLRSKRTYKGKFAFTSKSSEFDVKNILLNGEKQICVDDKNVQTWPQLPNLSTTRAPFQVTTNDDYFEDLSTTTQRSQRTSTTEKSQRTSTTTEQNSRSTTSSRTVGTTIQTSSGESCGEIKKMDYSSMLPVSPGQFPWVVAIYRYLDDGNVYKCAGTIIDKRNIVTSVNCLLEDGLLLKPEDVRVYVSPFSLTVKVPNHSIFEIAEMFTHEEFNQQLENNIAIAKLKRDIEFGDYVQPICLPRQTYTPKGKIGKLAGFGKSSMTFEPVSQILASAEYAISNNTDFQTFLAENTSGNSKISDLGSGLFVNEMSHWTLAGIMSKRNPAPVDQPQLFEFVNVAKFYNWIDGFNKPELPY